jgi:hypothetical protein
MPLDYDLYLEGALDLEQLMWLTEEGLGLAHEARVHGEVIERPGPGMSLTTFAALPLKREVLKETIGVSPRVAVSFTLDRERDLDDDLFTRILRVTAYLLEREPGDAVLLFNGELVIILRRAGRILVNERYGLTDEDLALLPFPYERAEIPVL